MEKKSRPKPGTARTVLLGTMGAAIPALIRSFMPTNFILYTASNLLMFFIFPKFDLEKELPAMREEVAARRAGKAK